MRRAAIIIAALISGFPATALADFDVVRAVGKYWEEARHCQSLDNNPYVPSCKAAGVYRDALEENGFCLRDHGWAHCQSDVPRLTKYDVAACAREVHCVIDGGVMIYVDDKVRIPFCDVMECPFRKPSAAELAKELFGDTNLWVYDCDELTDEQIETLDLECGEGDEDFEG